MSQNSCTLINGHGVPFTELTCVYPALKPLYTQYELNWYMVPASADVHDYMVDHPMIPIIGCVVYGIGIVLGRAYFAKRPRWNLRSLMASWNLSLAAFSAIGFMRLLPYQLHLLATNSMQETLCTDPEKTYGSGATGLWMLLFILSKFPELFDTFFVVVHKKKLIFLHWYHHITVLLYCWHSYVNHSPSGIFFATMNYGVHSIMYFYYFLMAIRIRPPWAMIVTGLQISQMVVGVVVTVMGFKFFDGKEGGCAISHNNNVAAFLMYGSYLALFVDFFVSRYVLKATTTASGISLQKKEA